MSLVVSDRIKESTVTSGTGTVTLLGAAIGFASFSVLVSGNTTYYTIADQSGANWEVGLGTYTTGFLSRDTVFRSSNANGLVNFDSATKDVFVTYPATKAIYLDSLGNSIGLGTIASGVATNLTGLPLTTGVTGTLPVANGGTAGTTALTARANLLPAYATNALKRLTINAGATDVEWVADGGGSVTSVDVLGGTTGLTTSGGPITTSGTITIAGTLGLANGGTSGTNASTARTGLGLGSVATLTAGVANGAATLDSGGTVPLSQIPASLIGAVNYQGTWNASTNTPTLASGVGTKGYYYVVSVAGTTNLDGITDWILGDWAIYSGTTWQKIDNTDAVTSVNGYTGTVVLAQSNIGGTVAVANGGTGQISYTNGQILIGNTTGNTLTKTTLTAGTGITVTNSTGSITIANNTLGTVTSISSLTLGTSGTDLSSTVANSTTTPVITLNVPTASASNRGALSSTDWSTFNNKGTVTNVTGTSPIVSSGGATPAISIPVATTIANGYLSSTDWTTFNSKGSGTVTSVSALTIGTTGTDVSSTVATSTTTPVITIQIPTASATNRGALSSADWSTFNNKGSGTVTSVGFTGGLISVATATSTPALTVAGTSGGIPYFTSTSTWASSALLSAGAIMLGGGAGLTPATTATGTGVVTALGVNIGSVGAVVVNGGALGTPASGVATNLTGTASSLTAGNVTTNANLTGMVTSSGNAAVLGSFTSANLATALTDETGTGAVVFGTSPTLTTPTFNSAQLATVVGTAPLFMCRAWVDFNGTGTVAINANGNLSSITDNGVGDYTLNFTTAMPDANYTYSGSGLDTDATGDVLIGRPTGGTKTTSAIRLKTISANGAATDFTEVVVVFLR